MTFIWPWMLLTLLLAPALALCYWRFNLLRRRAVAGLGSLGGIQERPGSGPGIQRIIPVGILLVGLVLLFFGSARPEMFVDLPRLEGTVILAFDISNSMRADDFQPSRMEAAKTAARSFVEHQPPGILVGIAAFSNGGLVVQSPTNDHLLLNETIDRLAPQGSTSLGQGIYTALNAIAGEPIHIDQAALEAGAPALDLNLETSAVVLLLTDGENTAPPDPLEVAQLAADAGVRIYTVGIGSPEGAVLEVDGFNVVTQLNEGALQEIASLTNGAYFQAEDEESLQEIYKDVDLQLRVSGEKMEVTGIFAGGGLLFFLVGGFLSLFWFGRMPV